MIALVLGCGNDNGNDFKHNGASSPGMASVYRVGNISLAIPTPAGYSVATKKFETFHDKSKRAAGGTVDNRFVLFVRDGSVDKSDTLGDTLTLSINYFTKFEMDDGLFAEIVKEKENELKGKGVPQCNSTIEFFDKGQRWFIFAATIKNKLPKGGYYYSYTMTGLVLVDGRVYTYVAIFSDLSAALKTQVKISIVRWLNDLAYRDGNIPLEDLPILE